MMKLLSLFALLLLISTAFGQSATVVVDTSLPTDGSTVTSVPTTVPTNTGTTTSTQTATSVANSFTAVANPVYMTCWSNNGFNGNNGNNGNGLTVGGNDNNNNGNSNGGQFILTGNSPIVQNLGGFLVEVTNSGNTGGENCSLLMVFNLPCNQQIISANVGVPAKTISQGCNAMWTLFQNQTNNGNSNNNNDNNNGLCPLVLTLSGLNNNNDNNNNNIGTGQILVPLSQSIVMNAVLSGSNNSNNNNDNNNNNQNTVSNSVACGSTDINGVYNFALTPSNLTGGFGQTGSSSVVSLSIAAIVLAALFAMLA